MYGNVAGIRSDERRQEDLMAITFKVDSTTGEGTFIRVLRDGRPFGKILDAVGLYRFYEGDHGKPRRRGAPRRGSRAAQDEDPIDV
jgi:hypothetical protein